MLPRSKTQRAHVLSKTEPVKSIRLPADPLPWLLSFGQRAEFTQGEWADRAVQAYLFAVGQMSGQSTRVQPASETRTGWVGWVTRAKSTSRGVQIGAAQVDDLLMTVSPNFPDAELKAAHQKLRWVMGVLVNVAKGGKEWLGLPSPPEVKSVLEIGPTRDGTPRQPVVSYHGPVRALFLIAVSDLLRQRWTEVRLCQREGCDTLFVPVRRQVFCSAECSRLAQWAKFIARHPRRKRDYRSEYVQRVRKQTSVHVKPGTRRTKKETGQ